MSSSDDQSPDETGTFEREEPPGDDPTREDDPEVYGPTEAMDRREILERFEEGREPGEEGERRFDPDVLRTYLESEHSGELLAGDSETVKLDPDSVREFIAESSEVSEEMVESPEEIEARHIRYAVEGSYGPEAEQRDVSAVMTLDKDAVREFMEEAEAAQAETGRVPRSGTAGGLTGGAAGAESGWRGWFVAGSVAAVVIVGAYLLWTAASNTPLFLPSYGGVEDADTSEAGPTGGKIALPGFDTSMQLEAGSASAEDASDVSRVGSSDAGEDTGRMDGDDGASVDSTETLSAVTTPEIEAVVHFRFGSTKLHPDSRSRLDDVAQWLRDHRRVEKVRIEGHSDNHGPERRNRLLARRRAHTVEEYLIEQGIEAERLETRAYGSEQPVASNETEEGRARNRRVEFIVGKPSGGDAPSGDVD